ncbi:MAG TPA: hypothetical protein VEO54_09715 [Thermoanaerobaculia bacterium]|nr:hypothetical protein [Thermoanaerobaculia bacterium]
MTPRASGRALCAFLLLFLCASALAGHRFHASAFAVGGAEHPAVGSVALPSAGGLGEAVVRDYDDGFVRFAEARSAVRGTTEGIVAVTTTEIVITDLSLGNRVHVDRLVARTNSRHSADAPEGDIDFDGSTIEGLTIDGKRVDVTLDTRWFAEHPTFASVRATGVVPEGIAGITCSAYEAATCAAGRRGLRIPDLGFLTIGEVFVKNGMRSIEMLRLDRFSTRPGRIRTLDGPPPPPVVVAAIDSNGAPSWP